MRLAVVLALAALAAAPSAAATLEPSSKPADVPVTGGVAADAVCAACCTQGAYCGITAVDTVLTMAAGGLAVGDIIPAGTNLTCYMQDRANFGAADAGRCVPNLAPDVDIPTFCSDFANAQPLVDVEYEATLVEGAAKCEACCNGTASCASGLTCLQLDGQWDGLCVPADVADSAAAAFCPGAALLPDAPLQCESCGAFSTAASGLRNSWGGGHKGGGGGHDSGHGHGRDGGHGGHGGGHGGHGGGHGGGGHGGGHGGGGHGHGGGGHGGGGHHGPGPSSG